MTSWRVGGHNLHDEAGRPKVWAALMFWTEAELHKVEKLHAVRRAITQLCVKGDPSMVLGVSRLRFVVEHVDFHRAHPGHPEITPMRGTLVVRTHSRWRPKRKQGLVLSHRINGSEPGHEPPPPYVDGEVKLRRELYQVHYDLDATLVRELQDEDRDVIAAGDYNRHGGSVWPSYLHMTERGNNPDRVAASRHLQVGPMRWLPKDGSDHPGWATKVTER